MQTPVTRVVPRAEVPDAVFELLRVGFPDDTQDQRAFWPDDSVHVIVYQDHAVVAHAGLITRTLYVNGRALRAAYVEYVAAEPRRAGHGTIAMRAMAEEISKRGFNLAALATGSPAFYERLGWRLWRGATAYRDRDGTSVPMPDEGVMVLDLGANVDLDALIEAEWRPGEIW